AERDDLVPYLEVCLLAERERSFGSVSGDHGLLGRLVRGAHLLGEFVTADAFAHSGPQAPAPGLGLGVDQTPELVAALAPQAPRHVEVGQLREHALGVEL